MKPTEVYQETARRADTAGTKIGAADVSRVLAVTFDLIRELPAAEAFDTLAGLLKHRPKVTPRAPKP